MRILIGGSPSTGSSLFRQILNRHSRVFCGPENYLFIYPQLFLDWSSAKRGISSGTRFNPLKAPGVFLQSGVRLQDAELGGLDIQQIRDLVRRSGTFQAFCDAFYSEILDRQGKIHWAEKSPANSMCFPLFLRQFENSHVIHCMRDPYDTITSLLKRGESLYLSASLYLVQTAAALRASRHPHFHSIRYEELVKTPAETLRKLLTEFDLEFEPAMLGSGNPEMTEVSKMQGWQFDETDPVQRGGIGKFGMLNAETRKAVLYCMHHLVIDKKFARRYHIEYRDFKSLLPALGYDFAPESMETDKRLDRQLLREKSIFSITCIRTRHWEQAWKSPVQVV